MIEKEFLDRLQDPETYQHKYKILRLTRSDGVLGYRSFQLYEFKDENGKIKKIWENPW